MTVSWEALDASGHVKPPGQLVGPVAFPRYHAPVSSDSSALDIVSPQIAKLATSIVFDGWLPPEPVLGKVLNLDWGTKNVTTSVDGARVVGDTLELDWDPHASLALMLHEGAGGDPRGKPLAGRLADGRAFAAEDARLSSSDRLVGRYWHVSTPGRAANVWVTPIHGMGRPTPSSYGNLFIVRNDASSSDSEAHRFSFGHYRFRGAYTYYLLKANEDAWFLIVDTGSERAPERSDVFVDMLTLQFVFGRAFYFNLLVGLDGSDMVGLVGGQHGRDHSHRPRSQPTIPLDFVDECWPAPFFERLSFANRAQPDLRLYIPLTFYLDALVSYSVEARYLALQVALESFAFWVTKNHQVRKAAMVDSPKWKAWLAENKERIVGLGTDPSLGESLLNQITSIPGRTPASRVVEQAFEQYGLQLTPEMAAELKKGRGWIVHRAAMFDERQESLDAYLIPIALVRTMLVALVARVAGYRGAIIGWTKEPQRPFQQADPSWWVVDDAARDEAFARFRLEE